MDGEIPSFLEVVLVCRTDQDLEVIANSMLKEALVMAADRGHTDVVRQLLAAHADVCATDDRGYSALSVAWLSSLIASADDADEGGSKHSAVLRMLPMFEAGMDVPDEEPNPSRPSVETLSAELLQDEGGRSHDV